MGVRLCKNVSIHMYRRRVLSKLRDVVMSSNLPPLKLILRVTKVGSDYPESDCSGIYSITGKDIFKTIFQIKLV